MSYIIAYRPEDNNRYPPVEKRRYRARSIAIFLFCVALLLTCFIWGEEILNFLLPGEPETTKAAFSNMLEKLRDGAQIGEVVDIFCREIIKESA